MRSSARIRESTAKKQVNLPGTIHEAIPLSFDDNDDGENVKPLQQQQQQEAWLTLEEVDDKLTVVRLQSELRRHGLKTSGRKNELIARLRGKLGNEVEHESIANSSTYTTSPSKQQFLDEQEEENKPRDDVPVAAEIKQHAAPVAAEIKQHAAPVAAEIKQHAAPVTTTTTTVTAPVTTTTVAIASEPTPAAATADPRFLRIYYKGRQAADTIRFDLCEPNVLEKVNLMLRSLFPGKIDCVDDKDIEPIYLLDEYNELYIVTMEFLKLASLSPTDRQAATIFKVCQGPLPTAMEDDKLNWLMWVLAVACSTVQLVVAWLVLGISPLAAFNSMARWTRLLFAEVRNEGEWSLSASTCLCLVYLSCFVLISALMSPSHRLGLKLWFPRLLALKTDAQRNWRKTKYVWSKQLESFKTRHLFRYAHPLPSRIGLPRKLNWPWLLMKRYLTVNLVIKLREFIIEAMFASWLVWQFDLTPWWLVGVFFRPTMKAYLQLPGFASAPVNELPVLNMPQKFQCIGRTASSLTLKWAAPNDIPQVQTTRGFAYSVGVSRYELKYKGQIFDYTCSPPSAFPRRNPPPLEELVFAITTCYHVYHVNFICALFACVVFTVALFTQVDDNGKREGMTVCLENLDSDTEFHFELAAYDELDRKGESCEVLVARTHPKTMLRRLLLVSEEVPPPWDATVADASETQGHLRYSGVVWNESMNEQEADMFLRTVRSAFLPRNTSQPPASETDALLRIVRKAVSSSSANTDFVFSDAVQGNVHQVMSSTFLQQLTQQQQQQKKNKTAQGGGWQTDPFLIVHPVGTRHTFARESIYSHLIVSKRTMDYILLLCAVLTAALHLALYSKQEEESLYWNPVMLDAIQIATYLWVCSNVTVLSLKALVIKDFGFAAHVDVKINQALDDLVGANASHRVRDMCLFAVAVFACCTVCAVFGLCTFTSVAMCIAVYAATAGSLQTIRIPPTVFALGMVGLAVLNL